MSDQEDYVYEDAPLVEVLAELRWQLLPIASMPGAEIDPHFERGHPKVQEALAENGFSHVERLVPNDVPFEVVAGSPIFRYRLAPDRWPLVQLGPGIMTVNITPPYEGWAEFRRTMEFAVNVVDQVFAFGSEFSMIKSCEVRYIDAFTERHGMHDPTTFLTNDLSMPAMPPQKVVEMLKPEDANVIPNLRFRFPVKDRPNDTLALNAGHGKRNGTEAVIYDLRLQHLVPEGVVKTAADVLKWMDEAHQQLHIAFENTISDELRERFGPKRAVRN